MNLNKHIKEIVSKKMHPIIFIAGMGGSGKTTFAKKLVAENLNAIHFELDWYHVYASKERHKRIQEAFDSKDQKRIDEEADPISRYIGMILIHFKKILLSSSKKGDWG